MIKQAAQSSWETRPIAGRIKVLRATRLSIAARAEEFAASVSLPGRRNAADTIAAEVIPLLDAIRFLEREAAEILRPRLVGRKGRPLWLSGVTSEIRRDPYGVVLVIAPFNYPLFLPGVQALQALAAGNVVEIKPAPGHSAPMRLLAVCLQQAGLPDGLFTILDETVAAAQAAIAGGVDKIVFTGSVASGKAVLRQAAETLTPCIVELSGNDAVFVLPGADVGIVVRALAYGLCLNGGATCIAPRRVFLPEALVEPVAEGLGRLLADKPVYPVGEAQLRDIERWLDEARNAGAKIINSAKLNLGMPPCIVIAPPKNSALLSEDIFAPILSLIPVASSEEALALAAQSPFALGASVFGPQAAVDDFAARLDAGVVVVNDLIVPSADPRLPFEARRHSGFGATRGREGLLAMTQARAIAIRRNRFYFHYRPLVPEDAGLFAAYAAFAHTGTGLARLMKEIGAWIARRGKKR